jgi:hypothetical protein
MDEQAWLTGDDVRGMIFHVREELHAARTKNGRRKLRLFVTGCFRLIWDVLPESARAVVEALEQDADGHPVEGGTNALYAKAVEFWRSASTGVAPHYYAAFALLQAVTPGSPAQAAERVSLYVEMALSYSGQLARPVVRRRHADLLRELFGNPFRPPANRSFPAEVRGLAQACYDDPAHYPVLADALDDLGESEMAAHCRQTGHAKGCHVVDRILGKG